MSDAQKLKDCIAEYRKANKTLDDNLKKAEANVLQGRQEREAESNR
ncbi:unnamed protein product [marine sediment metagenome]|uniref:Uncharacterized protein n=1 Tax=marine sediment metagenome TaxID=412755 RepID=X1LDJ5_9ZZZZ